MNAVKAKPKLTWNQLKEKCNIHTIKQDLEDYRAAIAPKEFITKQSKLNLPDAEFEALRAK